MIVVVARECLEFEYFYLFAVPTNLVLWIKCFSIIPLIKEECLSWEKN